jgi:glycosyltransferase involved in cell wall biosynthesis
MESLVSILLATYNWPEALLPCLESLNAQSDLNFEVIIADDGSTSSTAVIIEHFAKISKFSLVHVWQEDCGFRKALALNKAIESAKGEYLVFLDGDCLVQPDFVAQHRRLAEPGHLVTGSRVLMSELLTKDILKPSKQQLLPRTPWSYRDFRRAIPMQRLVGGINKFLPFYLKFPDNRLRNYPKFVWRRIKGCNMACWTCDALAIYGFDASLTGWGHEDADFVFRLQQAGVVRKSGAWATEVLHLFHPVANRTKAEENAALVRKKILSKLS